MLYKWYDIIDNYLKCVRIFFCFFDFIDYIFGSKYTIKRCILVIELENGDLFETCYDNNNIKWRKIESLIYENTTKFETNNLNAIKVF